MLQLKKSDLVLVMTIDSKGGALGQDRYDLYTHPKHTNMIVIHQTGVAAGWEIDQFSSLELTGVGGEAYKTLTEICDPAERYRMITSIETGCVYVDQDK